MTDSPRDQLLEYALGLVLMEEAGGAGTAGPKGTRGKVGAAPVDLAAEILAAWERGERSSATPADLAVPRAPSLTPRRLRPRLLGWRVAAGLVGACGIGLALWQLAGPPRPSGPAWPALPSGPSGPTERGSSRGLAKLPAGPAEPASLARASRPLPVLGGPGSAATRDLEADRRMAVDGSEPVTIALAGGRLELAPGSIFLLRERGTGMLLEYGEVRATGFASPFEVDFAFGAARLEPGAWLAARVEPDEPASSAGVPARRAAPDNTPPGRRRVELEVRAGRVLARVADEVTVLRELDSRVLLAPRRGELSPTALDREWIYERFLSIADTEEMSYGPRQPPPGRNLAVANAERASLELEQFLESAPLGWSLLQGILIDATDRIPARRFNLLGYLARDGSPRAVRIARSLWTRTPEDFQEDHLIAFAQLGAQEFEREIAAHVRLASAEAAAASAGGPAWKPQATRTAAYLALAGDDTGRALLETTLAKALESSPSGPGGLVEAYLAARALESLGDPAAWRSFAEFSARRALAGLEDEDVRLARWIATILELHDAPARPLPDWESEALWSAAMEAGDEGADALRVRLEAHLRD